MVDLVGNPPPDGEADRRGDPVRRRRARIERASANGRRIGYSCYGVAIAVFVVGATTRFTSALVTTVVIALGIGSVALAPAIVFGYAVKAAEREDRERSGPP